MSDTTDKNGHIRDRAYAIWESEGRVDGHHERHWHQASQELEGGDGADKAAGDQLDDDLPAVGQASETAAIPASAEPVTDRKSATTSAAKSSG